MHTVRCSCLLSLVRYFVQSVLKTIPSRIELFFFYMRFSSGPLHIVTLFGFNVSFSLLQSDSVDDPYERFLAGQRKREIDWKAARKSKKVKVAAPIPAPMIIETGSESPLRDDRVATLEGLLAAKTEECLLLMNWLDAVEEFSRKIIANQRKMQESFDKVKLIGS